MLLLRYSWENDENGVMIYEADPQMRILNFRRSNRGKFYVPNTRERVALPYLRFMIRYIKKPDREGVIYPGIFGSGLYVFGGKKPLVSLRDKIGYFYTDSNGIVCTDHRMDNKKFPTKEKLAQKVITSWFGLSHLIGDKILPISLEEALKSQTLKTRTYGSFILSVAAGMDKHECNIGFLPRE